MNATLKGFLGWAVRLLLVASYLAWLKVGFSLFPNLSRDPASWRFVATQNFPIGHRIVEGDFNSERPLPLAEHFFLPAEFTPEGKYTIKPYLKNQRMALSELSSTAITLGGAGVRYFFPLSSQMDLLNTLNTDSRIDVCAATCVAENVRVISIICSGTPSKCLAVLEMSPQEIEKVLRSEKDSYRLFLRR